MSKLHTVLFSSYPSSHKPNPFLTHPTTQFSNNLHVAINVRYCIVRPGGLGVGAPTGVITPNLEGKGGSIHRADVAAFLLGAVTDANFPFIRKTPALSSLSGTGWVKEGKPGFDKPVEL